MATTTAAAEVVSFNRNPDVREFPLGRLEPVTIGARHRGARGVPAGLAVVDLGAAAGQTHSCEAPHFHYHVSGVLRVRMDDGREFDCRAGDVSLFASGHDAWTVGDEPAVVVDFQGMLDYARAM